MKESIKKTRRTPALEALNEAHRLAVSPFVFQALCAMTDLGMMKALDEAGPEGLTLEALCEKSPCSDYAARALLEVAVRFGVAQRSDEGRFSLTNTGIFFVNDLHVGINFRFTRDVCYEGLAGLTDSLRESRPAGLKVFGDWPTIYPGIQKLPSRAKESWFEFDHHYSDEAYPKALPLVFTDGIDSITDVGGNTGKWARSCCAWRSDIRVAVIDLPEQCETVDRVMAEEGLASRVSTHPMNVLSDQPFPKTGTKAWWMSQFLDCFSPSQIVSILKKAHAAMEDDAVLYILEPLIGRQPFPVADACLAAMSLYFTALANGTSRFYPYDEFEVFVEAAGFEIERVHDGLGMEHTLLVCRKKKA